MVMVDYSLKRIPVFIITNRGNVVNCCKLYITVENDFSFHFCILYYAMLNFIKLQLLLLL